MLIEVFFELAKVKTISVESYIWGEGRVLWVGGFDAKFQIFSTQLLAPHTSGPRDVPGCGALSLLQKTPHYREDPVETTARLNAKLWTSVTGGWWWWWYLAVILPNLLSTRKLKANEERAVSRVE
jgi:hypothetical protein